MAVFQKLLGYTCIPQVVPKSITFTLRVHWPNCFASNLMVEKDKTEAKPINKKYFVFYDSQRENVLVGKTKMYISRENPIKTEFNYMKLFR